MIDGNFIRAEFARYLHEHTHTRWGLDAALMHVGRICYEQGIKDEKERKDMEHDCTSGVGCETAGVCYAEAHNKPEMCGRTPAGGGLSECQARLYDVLRGDDGQAWKEAERYLERERPDLYATLREVKPAAELRHLHALCEEMGEALDCLIAVYDGGDTGSVVESSIDKCRRALAKWKESK